MNYIDRLNELLKNSSDGIITQDNKILEKPMQVFNGFIGMNVIIKPYSEQNIGFVLDDEELYMSFLNKSGNIQRNLSSDINFIQIFLDEYFASSSEIEDVKNENRNIHSINKYKNRGGLCIHKATIANNLLQIFGYECNMICTNIGGENHAFIILKDGDKNYIYDPANKSKCYAVESENSKFNSYFKIPTLVEKTTEEIEDFYTNRKDLSISMLDEINKNKKQSSNIRIELPKLNYSCRKQTVYLNLSKKNILDEYRNQLKSKGLTPEEIEKVFEKIQSDVDNDITPKIESLTDVYEEIKNRGISK